MRAVQRGAELCRGIGGRRDDRPRQAGEKRAPVLVAFEHPREAHHLGGDGGHRDVHPLDGQVAVVEEETAAGKRAPGVLGEDARRVDAGEAVAPGGRPRELLRLGRRLGPAEETKGRVRRGVDLRTARGQSQVFPSPPDLRSCEKPMGGGTAPAVEPHHGARQRRQLIPALRVEQALRSPVEPLEPREPLLLRGGHQPAVTEEAARRIVVEGGDTEDVHGDTRGNCARNAARRPDQAVFKDGYATAIGAAAPSRQ